MILFPSGFSSICHVTVTDCIYRITSERDGLEACNVLHAAGPSKVPLVHLQLEIRFDRVLCLGSRAY